MIRKARDSVIVEQIEMMKLGNSVAGELGFRPVARNDPSATSG